MTFFSILVSHLLPGILWRYERNSGFSVTARISETPIFLRTASNAFPCAGATTHFFPFEIGVKGVLTTVGIRIYTKLKIIRPDIYKSNSLWIVNRSEA